MRFLERLQGVAPLSNAVDDGGAGQSPSTGSPAGAPPSRRRTSFFQAVRCSTISQIVCAPAIGRRRGLLMRYAGKDADQRRAVPRLAGVLTLQLIDEPETS